MIKLYMMDGPDEGQSFDLEADMITIGRSPGNDIQLSDRTVSRKHMKILKKDGKYFIEDLDSTNGTYVHGEQVKPGGQVEVKEGLTISIGMSLICLGDKGLESFMASHDSLNLYNEMSETGSFLVKNRPMTAHKNKELIQKVSSIMAQTQEIDEILNKILDYIFELFTRIDHGLIILIDPKTGHTKDMKYRDKDGNGVPDGDYSQTVVNRVLHEGKSIVMSDTLEQDESEITDSMKNLKIRSLMCIPLMIDTKIGGLIYLDSINNPYGFRNEDIALFTALGNSAAMAIENVRHYPTESLQN